MSDYIRKRKVIIGGLLTELTDDAYRILQNTMFSEIWREREHKCVISNLPLVGGRTYMFHHVLAKQSYERYALCKWNIMVLDYEIHNRYEVNPLTEPLIEEYKQHLLNLLDNNDYEFDNDHIWRKSDNADYTYALLGRAIKECEL